MAIANLAGFYETDMIPTVADCFRLMTDYGMLDNIRDHSLLVARVASLLVESIRQEGTALSMERVVAGALLHDIGKTPCLDTEEDHAEKGRQICLAHGMEEIAELVAQHVILRDTERNTFTEEEVVYYADKRVNHDQVVSLEERLAYILDRYGRKKPRRHQAIIMNFARCKALEARIFAGLPFAPDEVAVRLDQRLFRSSSLS